MCARAVSPASIRERGQRTVHGAMSLGQNRRTRGCQACENDARIAAAGKRKPSNSRVSEHAVAAWGACALARARSHGIGGQAAMLVHLRERAYVRVCLCAGGQELALTEKETPPVLGHSGRAKRAYSCSYRRTHHCVTTIPAGEETIPGMQRR